MFILLLARTAESVLPTIVSRCQVVPFRTYSGKARPAGIVVQNSGASASEARRIAIEPCDGSIDPGGAACSSSNELRSFRAARACRCWDACSAPTTGTCWSYGRELLWLVKLRRRSTRCSAKQAGGAGREPPTSSRSRPSARWRRATSAQLTAKTSRESLRHAGLRSSASWLRDVLAMHAPRQPELVINADVRRDALERCRRRHDR